MRRDQAGETGTRDRTPAWPQGPVVASIVVLAPVLLLCLALPCTSDKKGRRWVVSLPFPTFSPSHLRWRGKSLYLAQEDMSALSRTTERMKEGIRYEWVFCRLRHISDMGFL